MENTTLLTLLEIFNNFAIEFFELMDEIDSHKDVTLMRLKQLIDDRTKAIVQEARLNPEKIQNKVITHQIDITQTIEPENTLPPEEALPEAQIKNEDPAEFAYAEENRKLTGKNIGLKPYLVKR